MAPSPRASRVWLLVSAAGVLTSILIAQRPTLARSPQAAAVAAAGTPCAEMEHFLRTATIGATRRLPVGITGPGRATLSSAAMQHDASIQVTDTSTPSFESLRNTDANFQDSWKFNVAGYELAKILSLNMVPPYVERAVSGRPASLSWWINDAMMERDRRQRKIVPPQGLKWLNEMHAVHVYQQLIADADPNQTNQLITKDWRIWMIDFTRAFREARQIANPRDLVKCDRTLLANLRLLTPDVLEQKLGRWLTPPQIQALLARRDLIVRFFDDEIARGGEAAVLYDLPRSSEPCGTGLR